MIGNEQFDAWRATGRDVASISVELKIDEDYGPGPGRVYAGGLYIERNDEATRDPNVHGLGDWCAMLERNEYYGTLVELEARLYIYGISAGVDFDDELPAPGLYERAISGTDPEATQRLDAALRRVWGLDE